MLTISCELTQVLVRWDLLTAIPFSGPQFPWMIMRGSWRESNLFPRMYNSQSIANLCSNGAWVLPSASASSCSSLQPIPVPSYSVSLPVLEHTKHIPPSRLLCLLCLPPSVQSSHFPLAWLWLISRPLPPQTNELYFYRAASGLQKKMSRKYKEFPYIPSQGTVSPIINILL